MVLPFDGEDFGSLGHAYYILDKVFILQKRQTSWGGSNIALGILNRAQYVMEPLLYESVHQ